MKRPPGKGSGNEATRVTFCFHTHRHPDRDGELLKHEYSQEGIAKIIGFLRG